MIDRDGEPDGLDMGGLNSQRRGVVWKVPVTASLSGVIVIATSAFLIVAFRKRKQNQQNRATKASDETNKAKRMSVSNNRIQSGLVVKTARYDQKRRRPREPSSKRHFDQVGAGSALPSYLSGVDIKERNVETGLKPVTALTDDEESADGPGKQVTWRDGKNDTKEGQRAKESAGLVQQGTWESLTSWMPK